MPGPITVLTESTACMQDGQSALNYAANRGHLDCLKLMAGSDVRNWFAYAVENDAFADLVDDLTRRDRQLPYAAVDRAGRAALHLASGECRRRMLAALYLLGRYELLEERHRSATCVVILARDHDLRGAAGDGSTGGGSSGSACVLKLMREREQWERETAARGGCIESGSAGEAACGGAATSGLRFSPKHVLPVLRRHDLRGGSEADKAALDKRLRAFPFVLVLPRGREDLNGALWLLGAQARGIACSAFAGFCSKTIL